MQPHVTVDVGRFAERMVMRVRVKGARLFAFRIRCAIPLIRLAAAVAGMGIEIDVESGQNQ